MSVFFEILMGAALIGVVDVGFFHLYRFRLYAQPGSVAEEITHLARHVLFLGIVLTILLEPPSARALVLGLFALDLANTVADVLLERRSRAPLGGLPSVEYLLHVLGTLLTGMAIATFWHAGGEVLSTWQVGRGWITVGIGGLLLLAEAVLFGQALVARGRTR